MFKSWNFAIFSENETFLKKLFQESQYQHVDEQYDTIFRQIEPVFNIKGPSILGWMAGIMKMPQNDVARTKYCLVLFNYTCMQSLTVFESLDWSTTRWLNCPTNLKERCKLIHKIFHFIEWITIIIHSMKWKLFSNENYLI